MSSSSGGGAFARGTAAVPAGGARRTARFGFRVAATAALLSGCATQLTWQRRARLDYFVGKARDEFASSLGRPAVARYARTYAGVWAPDAATRFVINRPVQEEPTTGRSVARYGVFYRA